MNLYDEKVSPRFEFIRSLAVAGVGENEICRRLGISPRSCRRYRKEHPEFAALFAEIRAEREAQACEKVEAALLRRATGYDVEGEKIRHIPPDVRAAVFWLKNRRPELWKDRREVSVPDPVAIRFSPEEEKL